MEHGFGHLVSELARVNIALWHEEDTARSDDDGVVATAKRRIDRLNQQRNDVIERIDDYTQALLRRNEEERLRP